MSAETKNAPDAGQGIEGVGSHPYQRAETMSDSNRSAAFGIFGAARTAEIPGLNITRALAVWLQLQNTPNTGDTRQERLEVAINDLAELEGASL